MVDAIRRAARAAKGTGGAGTAAGADIMRGRMMTAIRKALAKTSVP